MHVSRSDRRVVGESVNDQCVGSDRPAKSLDKSLYPDSLGVMPGMAAATLLICNLKYSPLRTLLLYSASLAFIVLNA